MSNIEVCPECDSPSMELNNVGGMSSDGRDTKRYRCSDCGKLFDTPDTRPRRGDKHRNGMARELVKADPEDWP